MFAVTMASAGQELQKQSAPVSNVAVDAQTGLKFELKMLEDHTDKAVYAFSIAIRNPTDHDITFKVCDDLSHTFMVDICDSTNRLLSVESKHRGWEESTYHEVLLPSMASHEWCFSLADYLKNKDLPTDKIANARIYVSIIAQPSRAVLHYFDLLLTRHALKEHSPSAKSD